MTSENSNKTSNVCPSRRLVTGIDSDGHSYAQIDGPTRAFIDYGRAASSEIWIDMGSEPSSQDDFVSEKQRLLPPDGGSVCRVFTMRPEGRIELKSSEAKKFRTDGIMENDEINGPRWHTTATIDYGFILKGQIELLLDDGSHFLSAGDVVVQRATRHAWRNPGPDDCEIAFVLIDRASRLANEK